jgi:hypothetical protein
VADCRRGEDRGANGPSGGGARAIAKHGSRPLTDARAGDEDPARSIQMEAHMEANPSRVRRRFGRFERALPVELSYGGDVRSATTINLGLGGMQIESEADVAFDTPVVCRFEVPVPPQAVEAGGRVLWSRRAETGGWAVGIAFDALRPIDVWALLQYFNLSSAGQASQQQALLED